MNEWRVKRRKRREEGDELIRAKRTENKNSEWMQKFRNTVTIKHPGAFLNCSTHTHTHTHTHTAPTCRPHFWLFSDFNLIPFYTIFSHCEIWNSHDGIRDHCLLGHGAVLPDCNLHSFGVAGPYIYCQEVFTLKTKAKHSFKRLLHPSRLHGVISPKTVIFAVTAFQS